MKIWIDCDGVLADFDLYGNKLFRMTPRQFEKENGTERFWKVIKDHDDFFYKLPKMPDADELMEYIESTGFEHGILTGAPRGSWAAPQKLRWRDFHYEEKEMIVCLAKEKFKYCTPGDILIDDTKWRRDPWVAAGGIFVHHKNTKTTIEEMKKLLEKKDEIN